MLNLPFDINSIEQLLNINLSTIKRIGNGGNSQVYKLTCFNGKKYVLKYYYPTDYKRTRRINEFNASLFMWENGIRTIAKPYFTKEQDSYTIYEYIRGIKIDNFEILYEDIDQVIQFALQLLTLRNNHNVSINNSASDACFCIEDYFVQIETRIELLISNNKNNTENLNLINYIKFELLPFFNFIKNKIKYDLGVEISSRLDFTYQTLSPSDFGFHNCIRDNNNKIKFYDFEYFGWDDPAKLIADFLLHPGHILPDKIKFRFLSQMFKIFSFDKKLKFRFNYVYPLSGLKWCTILLNEFNQSDMNRRLFARNNHEIDIINKKNLQLHKSRLMLLKIKNLQYPINFNSL